MFSFAKIRLLSLYNMTQGQSGADDVEDVFPRTICSNVLLIDPRAQGAFPEILRMLLSELK